MRVVFVENHDSFSYNVMDLLPVTPTVVHAHEALAALEAADVVVVGPGPMDPERAGLISVVRAAFEKRLPYLGICLGHQALGMAFDARLTRTLPTHGKTATAQFTQSRLLPGIEGARTVMRYHSLSISNVPAPLRAIATLDDGTVMAVEHQHAPMLGLQFHPDSHATPDGQRFIDAFFRSLER